MPLFELYGTDMFKMLDAEFALIIYDKKTGKYVAARDPIGIRPLYYGYSDDGTIVFASEPKNLVGLCGRIMPFPPGCYYMDGEFIRYCDIAHVASVTHAPIDVACKKIHDKLVSGIEKRLDSDAPVGFLLSGGLDSSLVCSVAARFLDKPIKTFSVGMDTNAIDLAYARQLADYIGSDHTEVIINREEVIKRCQRWCKASRHLRYNHNTGVDRYVPCLQIYPRKHRFKGYTYGRDFGRAFRI